MGWDGTRQGQGLPPWVLNEIMESGQQVSQTKRSLKLIFCGVVEDDPYGSEGPL